MNTYITGIKRALGSQKGVTLLELVVVLAIFMMVIGVVVSMFISMVQLQKSVLKEQELINQASFAMDYISRSVRLAVQDVSGTCLRTEGQNHPGYIFWLTHYDGASSFFKGIKVLGTNGVCHEFFLDDDGVFKEIKDGGQAQALLSSSLSISNAVFIINGDKQIEGVLPSSSGQPRVTWMLTLDIEDQEGVKQKILQTTISPINLYVPN